MAADTPRDDAADGWLDALAGRPATRDATAQALRDALLPVPASAPAPAWSDLEARAAATPPTSLPVPSQAEPASPVRVPEARPLDGGHPAVDAANEVFPGQRWSRLAFAATVVLAVAVGMLWRPGAEDPQLRGVASTAGAVWRVTDPASSAQALAAELKALGAQVELQPDGASVRLLIRADDTAAPAVDRRLAALETALDAQHRLSLTVQPAPRP